MTDAELKEQLDKVDWPIEHGIVHVTLRDGIIHLVRVEYTIKYD